MAIGTPVSLGSTTENSGDATVALTCAAAVATGNHVFVFFACDEERSASTVTDSKGNTYAIDAQITNTVDSVVTGRFIAIASAKITSALTTSDTITGTHSGAGGTVKTIGAVSVSGLDATTWLDKTSTGTGVTAAWSSGATATTTVADEIIFGASAQAASVQNSAPDGVYNELFDRQDGGDLSFTAIYKIVSATGAQTASGVWGTGVQWAAAAATYKAAGGTNVDVTGVSAVASPTGPLPDVTVRPYVRGTVS